MKGYNKWIRFSLTLRWCTCLVVTNWLINVANTPLTTVTVVPEEYVSWVTYLPVLAAMGVVTSLAQLYAGWYAVLVRRTWWTTVTALLGGLLVTTSLVGLLYGWMTNTNDVVLFRLGGVRFVSLTGVDAVVQTLSKNCHQTMIVYALSLGVNVVTPERWQTFVNRLTTEVTTTVVVETPLHQLTHEWHNNSIQQVCEWLGEVPATPVTLGWSWWWYAGAATMVVIGGAATVYYFITNPDVYPGMEKVLSKFYTHKPKSSGTDLSVRPSLRSTELGDYIDRALSVISHPDALVWKRKMLDFLTALSKRPRTEILAALLEGAEYFDRWISDVSPPNPPPVVPTPPDTTPIVVPEVKPTIPTSVSAPSSVPPSGSTPVGPSAVETPPSRLSRLPKKNTTEDMMWTMYKRELARRKW